jgi:hypothetical protein
MSPVTTSLNQNVYVRSSGLSSQRMKSWNRRFFPFGPSASAPIDPSPGLVPGCQETSDSATLVCGLEFGAVRP